MKTIMALVLSLAAAPALGETVYKYVGPDGQVTYSSFPVAGSIPTARLVLDPALNVVQPPPPLAAVDESQRLEDMQTEREEREKAREEVILAQHGVAAAEAALIVGREPLPGERRGACVANGTSAGPCMAVNSIGVPVAGNFTSRLDEGYFERVARLEFEVEQAQARLTEAIIAEKSY